MSDIWFAIIGAGGVVGAWMPALWRKDFDPDFSAGVTYGIGLMVIIQWSGL